MEDALVPLVIVISAVAAAIALFTLAASGRLLRGVGSGGIEAAANAAAATRPSDEREQEIRDMLDACNASRERRGEPPMEPDDELAALARPTLDHELQDEVRAVVEARNRRRERAGLQPLDPDLETERQLRELT
jgi:uncharacterized protein YkwD